MRMQADAHPLRGFGWLHCVQREIPTGLLDVNASNLLPTDKDQQTAAQGAWPVPNASHSLHLVSVMLPPSGHHFTQVFGSGGV